MVMVPRSTCTVPLAVAAHLPDIMEAIGMSAVKVISSASIVPMMLPGIPVGMPEKAIDPFTLLPVWVSCQVMLPIPLWPIICPGAPAVVESEALPAQVPLTVAVDAGLGAGVTAPEDPPHAARNVVPVRSAAPNIRIWISPTPVHGAIRVPGGPLGRRAPRVSGSRGRGLSEPLAAGYFRFTA